MSNNIYSIHQLPKWFNGPTVLQTTLRDVWETPYYDLYEDDTTHRTFEAFERVLSAFGLPQESIAHRRYVYMGLAMALATRPTLTYRYPEDKRADIALQAAWAWLLMGQQPDPDWTQELFADYWTGAYTEANEAYDVFRNLLKALDRQQAYDAIFNMLDAVINDEAISPHHWAKRSIFNWWLTEVVPAAYYLRLPDTICTDAGEPSFLRIYSSNGGTPLPFGLSHDKVKGTEETVLSLDMQLLSATSVP